MPIHISGCKFCLKKDKDCQIKSKMKSYKIKEHLSYKCKEVESKYKVGDIVTFDYASFNDGHTYYPSYLSEYDIILKGEILEDKKKKLYIVEINKDEYNKLKDFEDVRNRCSSPAWEDPFNKNEMKYSIPVKESNILTVNQLKNKLKELLNDK